MAPATRPLAHNCFHWETQETRVCPSFSSDLLELAGLDVGFPAFTPEDLWSQLYGEYSAEAQSEGQLHMGLYRYQPGKDFGAPMSVFLKGTDPFYNLQLLMLIADLQRQKQKPLTPKVTVNICYTNEKGKLVCHPVDSK